MKNMASTDLPSGLTELHVLSDDVLLVLVRVLKTTDLVPPEPLKIPDQIFYHVVGQESQLQPGCVIDAWFAITSPKIQKYSPEGTQPSVTNIKLLLSVHSFFKWHFNWITRIAKTSKPKMLQKSSPNIKFLSYDRFYEILIFFFYFFLKSVIKHAMNETTNIINVIN